MCASYCKIKTGLHCAGLILVRFTEEPGRRYAKRTKKKKRGRELWSAKKSSVSVVECVNP